MLLKTQLNLQKCALFFLICSFPYFAIRLSPLHLSLVHLAIGFCVLVSVVTLIFQKPKIQITLFDKSIMIFLIVQCSYFIFHSADQGFMVLLKSSAYFFSYLAIRVCCAPLKKKDLHSIILVSSISGIILFAVTSILGALFFAPSKENYSLDYSGITLTTYRSISNLFSSNHELQTYELLRSTVVEGFVFYFIILLAWRPRQKILKKTIQAASLLCILCMFSRRAILVTVLSAFFYAREKIRENPIRISGYFAALIIVVSLFVFRFSLNTHVADVNIDARLEQMKFVSSSSWLFGNGLGTKLAIDSVGGTEKYIHNFIFSNFFMMGLFGLLTSLFILLIVLKEYTINTFKKNHFTMTSLLVLPLISMMVSSTSEGIFSPVSWTALAVYFSYLQGQTNSRAQC